jgi:hypothetical protein
MRIPKGLKNYQVSTVTITQADALPQTARMNVTLKLKRSERLEDMDK